MKPIYRVGNEFIHEQQRVSSDCRHVRQRGQHHQPLRHTGRPALGKDVDGPAEPLYSFGFGLAFTTFEFGQPESSAKNEPGGILTAHAKVTNTGSRAGTEVAEQTREVIFRISNHELGYCDTKGDWLRSRAGFSFGT